MKVQASIISFVIVLIVGGGLFLVFYTPSNIEDIENTALLNHQQGNAIGSTAIDFVLEDIDGNVYRFAEMQNSTIVITATPIDCHNCIGEVVGFKSIWESVSQHDDIRFFTISMHPENTLEETEAFRAEHEIAWPIIATENAFSFLRDYEVAKPATTIIIGAGGTIIHRDEYITKPSEIREILKSG